MVNQRCSYDNGTLQVLINFPITACVTKTLIRTTSVHERLKRNVFLLTSETAIPILYPDFVRCGHVHCDTFSSK